MKKLTIFILLCTLLIGCQKDIQDTHLHISIPNETDCSIFDLSMSDDFKLTDEQLQGFIIGLSIQARIDFVAINNSELTLTFPSNCKYANQSKTYAFSEIPTTNDCIDSKNCWISFGNYFKIDAISQEELRKINCSEEIHGAASYTDKWWVCNCDFDFEEKIWYNCSWSSMEDKK